MSTNNNSDPGAAGAGGVDTNTQVSDTQVDVAGILNFDPFAPPAGASIPSSGAEGGQGDGAGAGGADTSPLAPAPTNQPAQQAQPGQQQPQPGQQPGQQQQPAQQQQPDLAAAITQQTQAIAEMLARTQQPQQQQPGQQQPGQQQQPEAPKFNLGIPDQIMQGLASEDLKERSVAMHAVVNGVANHVWKTTETYVQSAVQEIVQSIPRIIEAHATAQEQKRAVAEDFFGTYEVFKNAAFVPLMQNFGLQIAQEMQAKGQTPAWSATFRDAIAERMFAAFPMLKQQHDAAVAARSKGANGQQAPKGQTFRTGGTARPAAAPVDEFEQILKVF